MIPTGYRHSRKNKVYCDKWVHEGICAFTQQGCKFKHEMPHDRATQQSLGLFHGYPLWYKRYYQNDNAGVGGNRIQPPAAGNTSEVQPQMPRQMSFQGDCGVNTTGSGTAGSSFGQGFKGLASGCVFDMGGARRPGPLNMPWRPLQPVQSEGGGENRSSIIEQMVSSMGISSSAEQPGSQSAAMLARQRAGAFCPFTDTWMHMYS